MDQVQAMRVFVRIVEAESFSRAAEKLGLPRATVSQTLKRLEVRLGVRLLQRTTRQVQVTDEGLLYYQRCVQLLAELDETDALFSHQRQQPSGRVRIDMPHSLARQVVIPSLPAFYRRYPQISLVLSANDAAINVLREGVDCVLRAWQVDDDSLVARSLPSLPQVTCASAAYCAEFGVPDSLEALATHRMVGYFFVTHIAALSAGIHAARAARYPYLAQSGRDKRCGCVYRCLSGRDGDYPGSPLWPGVVARWR
ncbi:hypothetical protein OS31_43510 [Dickeya oryzae]